MAEELNLEQKITVKNIAGWTVGFARLGGLGDVTITGDGSMRLSRAEVIAQVQNNNTLFVGIDGRGGHATLFIDDEATRKEVGFDSEDGSTKQEFFNDTVVSELFALKKIDVFKQRFRERVRTRAEQYAAIKSIQRLNLNDYMKIKFVEDYTGYKLQ